MEHFSSNKVDWRVPIQTCWKQISLRISKDYSKKLLSQKFRNFQKSDLSAVWVTQQTSE